MYEIRRQCYEKNLVVIALLVSGKRGLSPIYNQDVLSILGLFILNRFRKITYEEVIAMLKFDLMDTVAGRQLYEMGQQKGLQKGLQKELMNVRDMLLDALEARFGLIPHKMIDKIRTIDQSEMLNSLFKQAMRCPDLQSFKKQLS